MWKYSVIAVALTAVGSYIGGYYTATGHYLTALEDTQRRLTLQRMELQAAQLKKTNAIYQELNSKYQQALDEKNNITERFNALSDELDLGGVYSSNTDSADNEPLPSDTRATAGTEQNETGGCSDKSIKTLKRNLLEVARDYDMCATDYNQLLKFYQLLREQYNGS